MWAIARCGVGSGPRGTAPGANDHGRGGGDEHLGRREAERVSLATLDLVARNAMCFIWRQGDRNKGKETQKRIRGGHQLRAGLTFRGTRTPKLMSNLKPLDFYDTLCFRSSDTKNEGKICRVLEDEMEGAPVQAAR